MVSALNLIGSNDQLQSHWLRRFIAAIIDGIIMFVISIIIVAVMSIISIVLPGGVFLTALITGSIWLLYSWILEGMTGSTIGKRLMNMVVVSVEGPMDLMKALIRNISKIYGLAFLIDWIIGFVTDGDPRQRFMDRIANTTVVRTDVQEIIPGAFQPPGGPIPAPVTPQQAPYGEPQQPQYTAPQTQQTPPSQPAAQPEPSPAQTPVQEETAEPQAEVSGDKTYARSELVAMRKDDLTKIARQKNIKTTGTKRDLIDRILGEDTES